MTKYLFAILFFTWTLLGTYNVHASAVIQDGSVTPQKLDARTATSDWLLNCGLSTSVATNALTINLKTNSGATPTALSPCKVFFRNATAATGQYAAVSATSAKSIVVPSSATLGQTSNVASYVWIYALSDSGIDLCVNGGDPFDDTELQASTTISSGSTSNSVLYCGSSHSGSKPIRLLARCLETQTVAGTWAANCTSVDLKPVPKYNVGVQTTFSSVFTNVVGAGCTGSPAPGVNTQNTWYQRRGRNMLFHFGYLQTSASGASNGSSCIYGWSLPQTLDTTNLVLVAAPIQATDYTGKGYGSCGFSNPIGAEAVLVDSTHFFLMDTAGNQWSSGVAAFGNTVVSARCDFELPVSGWFNYGP